VRGAEDLTAVTAVVLSTIEGVELFIAFETVYGLIVTHPLLLGTEGGLYYLLHLLVHQQLYPNIIILRTNPSLPLTSF
jgi:hypothetical protein